MCNLVCGVVTTVLGVALVGVASYLGFGFIPTVVRGIIESEVQLLNDTEQMERFEEVPFSLEFNVRIFTITNPEEVMSGGVPVMNEVGPYVYKMNQSRIIEGIDEDTITYRRVDTMEFDKEASYPCTEDDMLTVANVAYHGLLQTAERLFPNLMGAMNLALGGIFGNHTSPITTVRVGDFLMDGVSLCKNPGLIGGVACTQVHALAGDVRNIDEMDDGSLSFAILRYKHNRPSSQYVVSRGIEDPLTLGIISTFNGSEFFDYWQNIETDDEETEGEEEETEVIPSVCNMINGTDSGIFRPFIDREKSLYAINTDICRSIELRYESETSYEDIPAVRYVVKEWLLDNDEGCFCLNVTNGINREDGCLLRGALEMYTCVGALLVLTYPHFLYADFTYRHGVIGMTPIEDKHRIFVDFEPNTGTVIRGAKRAQFNVFFRPVAGITSTQNLRTTLVPILWVEETMSLPEDYVDILKSRLLQQLRLVEILVPVIISVCGLVVIAGVIILIRSRTSRKTEIPVSALKEEAHST